MARQGQLITSSFDILKTNTATAASRLLGSTLIAMVDGTKVQLKIVETEAYDQTDAASHSYKGNTPRTGITFGPAGYLYVYFTYGMHYCCNVVVGRKGDGAAALIRAVEPLGETRALSERRGGRSGVELTNGPAKLCQALGITRELNGHDLRCPPLQLQIQPALSEEEIVTTTRIGIKLAVDMPWRFYIKDNPYVSAK